MGQVLLHLPYEIYEEILEHLLPESPASESAGFLFVVPQPPESDTQVYEHIEWYPVHRDGFVDRSWYHLELTDETRAYVIKRAHDLRASIVEVHSHPGSRTAAFSYSDHRGFREFVPHVWWRLKGRPYFAVVVSPDTFDGLAWIVDPTKPQHLDGIVVGNEVLKPTKRSSLEIDGERFDRSTRFFGQSGQDRLSTATVAVVGIGGLGTHVVQQLALLGLGRLVLIDDEDVAETNRNRYIGLRHDDPVPGLAKVTLGRRLAEEINPQIEIISIRDSLRSAEAFDAIVKCDYVVGCLDNDGARLILNMLCSAYAKPYVDLGTDILDDGASYGGRVCVVRDGEGCLFCYDELDAEAIQVTLMNNEQRTDRATIYGVPVDALGSTGPSVVSINGIVASLGVTELMLMATGMPRAPRKILKYYGTRGIVTVRTGSQEADCYYCSRIFAKGDEAGLRKLLTGATP